MAVVRSHVSLVIRLIAGVTAVTVPLLHGAQAQAGIFDGLFRGDRGGGQATGRARGAGIRGERWCGRANVVDTTADNHDSFLALVPEVSPATTVEPYPTFWLHLPLGQSEDATRLEFELLNADGEFVAGPISLQLPETSGIASFQLPWTETALEIGQTYEWSFSIVCDEDDFSANPFVYGSVKRLEPTTTLIYQLSAVADDGKYAAYVQNGIWYETLTQLATHRQTRGTEWTEFLKLFDLDSIAAEPVYSLISVDSN